MVSPISSGSGSYDTISIQRQMRSQAADRILKKVDANQDGKITLDELGKVLEAGGNQQGPSAAELLKQLDQGNKGYVTKQDIENGLAKAEQNKPAQGQQRMRPGGGGGSPPTDDSTSTSTAYSFDPQDLNQDGVVTMREKIQYVLNLYAAQQEAGSSVQASLYA
jgi:Ca2+-binding EF-hand superfamily protein